MISHSPPDVNCYRYYTILHTIKTPLGERHVFAGIHCLRRWPSIESAFEQRRWSVCFLKARRGFVPVWFVPPPPPHKSEASDLTRPLTCPPLVIYDRNLRHKWPRVAERARAHARARVIGACLTDQLLTPCQLHATTIYIGLSPFEYQSARFAIYIIWSCDC